MQDEYAGGCQWDVEGVIGVFAHRKQRVPCEVVQGDVGVCGQLLEVKYISSDAPDDVAGGQSFDGCGCYHHFERPVDGFVSTALRLNGVPIVLLGYEIAHRVVCGGGGVGKFVAYQCLRFGAGVRVGAYSIEPYLFAFFGGGTE